MATELKLEGEEIYGAQIELLIQILATQKATATVLIEMLAKTEEEEKKATTVLIDRINFWTHAIAQRLSEQRGTIDLNEILGGG